MKTVEQWKAVLRTALRDAMRARDAEVIAVLRETLGAIDNAEAVDTSAAPPVHHGVIAGSVPGLAAGEVPRRALTADAVTAIIEREIAERRQAAATYESLGRADEARALLHQVDVLSALL